jgi:hypothetical protein
MNKTDVVLDEAIKTRQDAPTILEPCKQALHFPAPPITAELSLILRLLLLSFGSSDEAQSIPHHVQPTSRPAGHYHMPYIAD